MNEAAIVTAVHNIKSNKGSKTAGADGVSMDRCLQMPGDELITLIQSTTANYKPKPARKVYIPKSSGKRRPLGIPAMLDRDVGQNCPGMRENHIRANMRGQILSSQLWFSPLPGTETRNPGYC